MIWWKRWSNKTQNANHTTADNFCSAELPPLPTSAANVLTPSPNPDPPHTTSEPRPTVTYPPQSPDNFCASKAAGVYAKPDDPGSFYSCANGITWVMPCPANLVFWESCLCCSYPWEQCLPFLKSKVKHQIERVASTVILIIADSDFFLQLGWELSCFFSEIT